ncbi:MAG: hypothetical protein WCY27_00635 [archaeon]|nr:hypothetical protein [archaeon]
MGIIKKFGDFKKKKVVKKPKKEKPKTTLKKKIENLDEHKYQVLLFGRVPKRIESIEYNKHNCKVLYFDKFAVIENFLLTKKKTKFDFKSFKEMIELSLKNIKNHNLVTDSKISKVKFATWIFFNHPEIKKSINISKSYNEQKFAEFIKRNKIQKIRGLNFTSISGNPFIILDVKINNKLTKIVVPEDTLPHYEIKI